MPDPATPTPDQGATIATFSGLKNTVPPEMLTARELSRARNVDLDDLGALSRRRGRTRRLPGRWHSLHTTKRGRVFGVCDLELVEVRRDYSTALVAEGVGSLPIDYIEVGDTLYFRGIATSGRLDLARNELHAWCNDVDHAYEPPTRPGGPGDWWCSPVVDVDLDPVSGIGAVGGKLLGPPPLGGPCCFWNGRAYMAAGAVLWASELYLPTAVDRNSGFRQYEAEITGLVAVQDGYYVGTAGALYFVSGQWGAEKRALVTDAGVLPRSMIPVPGELVDPEGRRFPDLPRQQQPGMACVTAAGIVVGLGGGNVYNLTQSQFQFPQAEAAPTYLRQEDGANHLVSCMRSSGPPSSAVRFGDHIEAVMIRAPTPGQPSTVDR